MKLSDFKGVLKTHIITVKSAKKVGDKYIVEFENDGITWTPGEHAIFSMLDKKVNGKKWRGFSIASTPNEGVIRIATKIPPTPSSFKQALMTLRPGDTAKMRGPFGWFYRKDDTTPVVMVALGIGITPILAMVNEFAENPVKASVQVIYSSNDGHLFKSELNEASTKAGVRIGYVKSSDQTKEMAEKAAEKLGNLAYYYVSGAPSSIKNVKKIITSKGVKRSRIISDPYLGY